MSAECRIEINIGVYVGKSKLDIVLHPLDLHFQISNNEDQISKIVQVLKTHNIGHIVVEATGLYEHAFVFACDQADLLIVVVNPISVRRYAQAIDILVGAAPMNRENGSYNGKRRIRGGRRRILMAMLSSIQCNLVFKRFYEHLKSQGKLPKVAVIACMRKLIVVLNTLMKNEERWCEKTA